MTAAGVARRGSLAETRKCKSSSSPTGGEPSQGTATLAQARKQLTFAKTAGILVEYIKILESSVQQEEKSMRQAQSQGQRKDQARARFKKVVVTGEKAMETLQKAQQALEQAQQEVVQAYMDLEHLEREAPSLVVPTPQTNSNLVGTLETLTGIIEHLWNLDAGPPLENLVSAIHASRSLLHASSDLIAQEDDPALAAKLVEKLPDFEVDEEEHLADFEEMHAPGAEDDRSRDLPVLHDLRSRGLRNPRLLSGMPPMPRKAACSNCSPGPCRIPGTRNSRTSRCVLVQRSRPWQTADTLVVLAVPLWMVMGADQCGESLASLL